MPGQQMHKFDHTRTANPCDWPLCRRAALQLVGCPHSIVSLHLPAAEGLIFCISVTPHLGTSFPLFHVLVPSDSDIQLGSKWDTCRQTTDFFLFWTNLKFPILFPLTWQRPRWSVSWAVDALVIKLLSGGDPLLSKWSTSCYFWVLCIHTGFSSCN